MANPTGKRDRGKSNYCPITKKFVSRPIATFLNEKGYLRYSNGPHRNKYVHRVVIENLLGHPIPSHMVVHHSDHIRTHNCPSNLQLLDKVIHDRLSLSHLAFLRDHPELMADRIQKEYEDRMPDWCREEMAG